MIDHKITLISFFISNSHFILCEIEEVKSIVAQNGSCFQLVTDNLKLIGYKVAVIQKWVMDTSRYNTKITQVIYNNVKIFQYSIS